MSIQLAMSHSKSNGPAWLPLGQAAKKLGVHPTTLRRWAENGDFPVMVTPGGHRRFASADLERFAQDRSRPVGQGPMPEGWQKWSADELGMRWTEDGVEGGRRLAPADVLKVRDALLDLLSLVPAQPEPSADMSAVRSKAMRLSEEAVGLIFDRGLTLTECTEMTQYLRTALPQVVLSNPALESAGQNIQAGLRNHLIALVDGLQLAVSRTWEDRARGSLGGQHEPRRYGRTARYRTS
jgi:excisionase family DNA binding protein